MWKRRPRSTMALSATPPVEGGLLRVDTQRLLLPLRTGRLEQSEAAVRLGQWVDVGQPLSRPWGSGARVLLSPVRGRVLGLPLKSLELPVLNTQLAGPLPLPCVELGELEPAPESAEEAWRQLETPALRQLVNAAGLEGVEGLPLDLELELLPRASRLVVLARSTASALDRALLQEQPQVLAAAVAALCRLRELREVLILHAPQDRDGAGQLGARLEALLPTRLHSVAGGHGWDYARLAICAAGLPSPSARRTLASQGLLVCDLSRLCALESMLRRGAPGPMLLQAQGWRAAGRLPEVQGAAQVVEVWPGTPLSELIRALGHDPADPDTLWLDGTPLDGSPLLDPATPLLPGHRVISRLPVHDLPRAAESPCISCGHCLDICPVHLTPVRLARLVEEKRVADARRLGLEDCLDCGLCSWICPSHLELGHSLRKGLHAVREGRHGA